MTQLDRPAPKLSHREQQLLELAAEGLTDLSIAQRLGISEPTVGTYWGRVRIKYGPHSRTELVAIMLRAEREAAIDSLRKENEHLIQELRDSGEISGIQSCTNLLQQAPDAILLLSDNGKIEFINAAAAELLGYKEIELLGRDHSICIPERFQALHASHVREYLADPKRHPMGLHIETPAVMKDGTEIQISASLSTFEADGQTLVFCIVRLASD